MKTAVAFVVLGVVVSTHASGCGKSTALENAEKGRREADARVVAAEKTVAEQRALAEKALADKEAAEKTAAEEKHRAQSLQNATTTAELKAKELAVAAKAASASPSVAPNKTKPQPTFVPTVQRKYPAYLTAYDIMTPEDEFYFHHLDNMCLGGDIAKWPLVKALVGLGQNLVDANLLANLANETIHISDQKRAAPIIKTVKECAELLQIEAPPVHIDGSPEPNAYVAGLREPHVLVFTSGLLDLFEESPEELRFIIGHELGHIKAKHLKTHFVGNTFVSALLGDTSKKATFKDDFIAALSVGTLLHWYRESEYSADRAGLLCVGGDLTVAKQALLRLLHQTKPSNKLFDPSHPEFDAELVLKNQMRLRDQPFVSILSYLRQFRQSHPFIPERCAALGMWTLTAEYQTIVERPKRTTSSRSLLVTSVEVKNIPKVDTYVPFVDSGAADPFVKVTYAASTRETKYKADLTDVNWSGLEFKYDYTEGAGIILELYDYNSALSNKFIGSCLLPINLTAKSVGTLKADLRLDVLDASTIVDRPMVIVEYRIEENK